MVVVQYICAFILLSFLVKAAWPDTRKQQADATRKQQAEADRKHREILEAVAKLERQSAPPAPKPPTHNSAERARVLALGRIRDGENRHPILDAPHASLAKNVHDLGNAERSSATTEQSHHAWRWPYWATILLVSFGWVTYFAFKNWGWIATQAAIWFPMH